MRIRERDLAVPALRTAGARPDGFITTADLITTLEADFEPEGDDAEILEGRQDSKFSQIVRNLVSHRDSPTSIFAKGYAEYVEEERGIRITDAGRAFLSQVPE